MDWSEEQQTIKSMADANSQALLEYLDRVRLNTIARYQAWANELGMSEDALEVISGLAAAEGLTKAIREVDKWDPNRAGFERFATLKAIRIARRHLQRIEREVRIQPLADDAPPFDPPMRYSFWERVYQKHDLVELLSCLKPEHAEIIRLRVFERQRFVEIAIHLERSAEAARALYHRAIAAARKKAADRGHPPASTLDEPSIIKLSQYREQKARRGDKSRDRAQIRP